MALRIRRGTNAQRLLITPLQGELIYTTDTKQLFVGDGTTLGGVAVDTGSVAFASIGTDVTPDADNTRDIGAVGNRWAEGRFVNIFGALTGNVTGNLTGDVLGNVTGNVTGNLTGNVTGDVNGNVTGDLNGSVFADDSTAMLDAIQKRITADVYSSAGTLLLSTNPATNVISNGDVVITDNVVTLLNGLDTIQFGTNNSALGVGIRIKSPVLSNKSIETTSLTDGVNADSFEIQVSRGTLSIPTSVQQGDPLFTIVANAYDGSDYRFSSAMFAGVEADTANPVAPGSVPGSIGFATSDDGGTTLKTLLFNSFGRLGVGVLAPTATLDVDGDAKFAGPVGLAVTADDTARTALGSPLQGQLIFMQSGTSPAATNKVQVYDGAAWVNLH
jgi:hypothetical protein